jgi:uncharacterized delta-60 repeat protein
MFSLMPLVMRRRAVARLSRKFILLIMIMLVACWPLQNRVRAAARDLDSTFGVNGLVVTEFFGGLDEAKAVLIQRDGRIVAVGTVDEGRPNANFGLARYNLDGRLDSSFGSGRKVITDFFGNIDFGLDAVLQPDGKIVAAGETFNPVTGTDFALARYNSDGSLDATFGIGGKVTTDFFGSLDQAFAVTVQPDGKIVLAGGAVNNSRFLSMFALARYNSDGGLDSTFGSGGKVTTSIGILSLVFDVIIQPDGKIIAAGYGTSGDANGGTDLALARYNADGSLDTAFGVGGKVTLDIDGSNDNVRGLALQRNGKIVAAGSATIGHRPDTDFVVARFNTDGSVDSSFGTNGKVTTDFAGKNTDEDLDSAYAVAIQSDGKIVAAGTTLASDGNFDFMLARYLGDEVNLFDVCLQDDSNGNILQLNLTTGDYQFTRCGGGLTFSGTGVLTSKGGVITLQHYASDRRVVARIDTGVNRGTASFQHLTSGATFTIVDRNTANNTCSCP